MRRSLAIDIDRRLCTVTTEGEATVEGFVELIQAIVEMPGWRPGFSVLADHRKLCVKGIQFEGIGEISDFFIELTERLGPGRLALTMNKDIDFGIARAWELTTEASVAMAIRVFRDLDEARAWIEAGFTSATPKS